MFTYKTFIVTIIGTSLHCLIGSSISFAQENIPLGNWRMHLSYNSIFSLALGNEQVYGAARNGVMVLDRTDKSIRSYNKLNGLSGADISVINYDKTTNQLLIAYADGNIDLIKNNTVTNFNSLKNSTAVAGSKRINHITIHLGLAYLSTDYGMVVFDLERQEVKETWRDLGINGVTLKIIQSTFKNDSIFLATEKGLIAGDLRNNLLDYNNWKRFQQGIFNTTVQSVVFFNNKVYAAISGSGLYNYANGAWTKELFLQNVSFKQLAASTNNLLIAQDTKIWMLNSSNTLLPINTDMLTKPQDAVLDDNGKIWIGDTTHGLISDAEGTFISYLPNGPSISDVFRLTAQNNIIVAIAGGYSKNLVALGNSGDVNTFSGTWSSELSPLKDITDIDFRGDEIVASSFGFGLQTGNLSTPNAVYNKDNSTLLATSNLVNITALKNSAEGTWVANYGVDFPLHLLGDDNTWQSFQFIPSASKYPIDLAVDTYGNVWMLLDPAKGGGIQIFNKESNKKAYLSDAFSTGGLPSRSVHAIAIDRDGYVWVGTDQGVSYFPDSYGVFGTNVDAIEPIFESRYLLSDQRVTAIAIDGGNRKWIGTEKGVWLFNPTTEEVVYNFTAENSPLLSNVIRDIAINEKTGEVFFATDKGIVSYHSDASESELSFKDVKIFPNPVTSDYRGTIGIMGLATDAVVKITTISGRLVWQTQANGGTATWNGNDYNGKRATTGIYLVFSATQDGTESFVGKVAMVE